MCITTTHWATHISTECATGGSGQCDGYCYEHDSTECTCPCHGEWDLPIATAGVRDWHDNRSDVVASFERGDETEQWSEAANAAERLNDKPVDGSLFKVRAGQNRTVIVKEYS